MRIRNYIYQLMTDARNGIGDSFFKGLLYILSVLYRIGYLTDRLLYTVKMKPSHSLGVTTISIGNITVGGTGKTPFVEYVAGLLTQKGKDVCVLIRGYMQDSGAKSDEATMLHQALEGVRVLAGRDRVKNARSVLARRNVDAFILDDGFQHWRAQRDMDIVLIDTTNPFGNGHLIPRGIMREPVHSLARADVCVLTKVDHGKDNLRTIRSVIRKFNKRCLIAEARHFPAAVHILGEDAQETNLEFLSGKRVCGVCSIGDPNSFYDTLEGVGSSIAKKYSFMDHHIYSGDDVSCIIDECKKDGIGIVVTTQKDIVKLKNFHQLFKDTVTLSSLIVKIEVVQGNEEFSSRIYRLCDC